MTLRQIAQFRFKPVEPYDFELTVRKPAGWSWFTPFETWDDGTIRSGFWFETRAGAKRSRVPIGVKARAAGKIVAVDVYAARPLAPTDLARLKNLLNQSLGVDEDLRPLYRLMRGHPILKHLARRLRGMHEGWGMNIFSSLSLAVLLQMAPIKRSQDMWDCLIRSYGRKIAFDGASILLWPDEATIAALRPAALAKRCRLGYRAKFLVRLARQLRAGFPGVEELAAMSAEEAEAKLMELFGVGAYSAGFASPHPSFMIDVWSVRIFHFILFGRPVPPGDPRAAIAKTLRAAEKAWGEWRGYILVYVLNDLPYLAKKFGVPVA